MDFKTYSNYDIEISDITSVMVNIGATAQTYTPYNGNTYTIALGDTYYGGELDVVNGVLTVTWIEKNIGDLNWTNNTTYEHVFNAEISPYGIPYNAGYPLNATWKCETYEPYKSTTLAEADLGIAQSDNGQRFYIKDINYSDASSFKQAMGNVKIIYELATPIIINLTPIAVKSLEGINNIFADSGQIEELSYFSK